MSFVWDKLRDNLKKLQNGGVEVIVKKLVSKDSDDIVDFNTDNQLFDKGINNDGTDVEPAYTKLTVSIKKQKGQPTNRVTLKDTGSFHKKFFLDAEKDGFRIDSTDSKTDDLVEKYGKKIFGLTDNSKGKVSLLLKKDLIKQLKKKL